MNRHHHRHTGLTTFLQSRRRDKRKHIMYIHHIRLHLPEYPAHLPHSSRAINTGEETMYFSHQALASSGRRPTQHSHLDAPCTERLSHTIHDRFLTRVLPILVMHHQQFHAIYLIFFESCYIFLLEYYDIYIVDAQPAESILLFPGHSIPYFPLCNQDLF